MPRMRQLARALPASCKKYGILAVFAPRHRLSSRAGRARKGELESREVTSLGYIQSGDTWTFKSGTPPGEPPERYRGGLLDLAVSSATGELLGSVRFERPRLSRRYLLLPNYSATRSILSEHRAERYQAAVQILPPLRDIQNC